MNVDSANAASGLSGIFGGVTTAIRRAAEATGANFEYLLATAKMESNFNPHAAAGTSSAKGLYQFIEQTWLGTVKEAGPALGFSGYADAIARSPSGTYLPAARTRRRRSFGPCRPISLRSLFRFSNIRRS